MLHTLISEIAFALESFLLDAEARQLRPATLRYYRQQLTWFVAHCQESGVQKPEEITAHLIRAYLAGLQARGLSASSVHAAARAVRAFANFLEAEGLVAQSPMRRVRMPKVDKRLPDAYTVDEVERLLACATSNRDRAIVLCLLDSGCRASEFLSWNVGDVNVMTGTVHVRHGKNRSERTVYLGVKARRSLLKHLGGLADRSADKPVWANEHTGERLLDNGLRQALRRLGRAAGVSPCNAHKFRRTFATWCLQNGMNIYDLKTLMGHSGLEMLLRYLDTDAMTAHRRHEAVDRTLRRVG